MSVAPVVALLLGVVAGMRTLMAPALYFLARGPLMTGVVFGVLALAELIGDLLPFSPARTRPLPLVGRMLSGAIVGWFVGKTVGMPLLCLALGVVGALLGAFGGYALRTRAIGALGRLPAAFVEDAVAVGLGIVAVTR